MSTIRRRGVTLVELIVAMAVGLLLLTATYELMIPGLRSWSVATVRSHVRQTALAILTRMAHDVKMSSIESLVVIPGSGPDPDGGAIEERCALTLMSPIDDDGVLRQRDDGTAVWQKYVLFYLDVPSHELRIGTRPLQFDPTKSVPVRLATFTPDPARDRVIGRGVRGLGVETAIDRFAKDFQALGDAGVMRANPVLLRVHIRQNGDDCTLENAIATQLVGDTAGGDAAP